MIAGTLTPIQSSGGAGRELGLELADLSADLRACAGCTWLRSP